MHRHGYALATAGFVRLIKRAERCDGGIHARDHEVQFTEGLQRRRVRCARGCNRAAKRTGDEIRRQQIAPWSTVAK